MDNEMKMNNHITKVCQSAHFHLRNIGKVRNLLDVNATKTLVHSLVSSRLDYCNSLLMNVPENARKRLQLIQNKSARLVSRTRPRDHITPVLKSLHWLPLKERIDFKIACPIYKSFNHEVPSYISGLVEEHRPARTLRSSSQQLLKVQRSNLISTDKAFSVGGPKLWNSLSTDVRTASSLSIFKNKLKTELFKRAFED